MSSIQSKEIKLKGGIKVNLRTALIKDSSQIVKLMRDVIKEGPFTLAEPDEYKSTIRTESAKIKRFKNAVGKIYLVLTVGKEVTGFIAFDNWDTRRTAHTGLFSVFIKKKWRGLGIGKILVNGMLEWAKTNPLNRKISLFVFSTNKNAIDLYKKLGFRQEGRCPRDMIIDGEYVDSIMMYKFTK